jgi:trehalose-phosphatase
MNGLAHLPALLKDPFASDILAARRDGLLLLDYDGTLAPFVAKRDEAWPYPGVTDILSKLPTTGSGRFIVVSGRPAADIVRFLHKATPLEIWGCHGAERLSPGQSSHVQALPSHGQAALAQALALAVGTAPPGTLEQKPVSVALHWRGQSAATRQALQRGIGRAWLRLARGSGLELHAFDGGLELRLPGQNKGRPVHALRRENPGTSLVYLGDDITDEDAFKALGPTDLGVLVRAKARPTAARYRITPPGELLRFLALWADAAAPGKLQPGGIHAG